MSKALPPRIWALLSRRRGDNNQVLALAQALGYPFETRTIRTNVLRKLPKALLRDRLISLTPRSRRLLQPPWPDLVIAMGHRPVPAVRYIKRRSNGRTRLVHLGNPRLSRRFFDLVIAMPQYGMEEGGGLIELPMAMGTRHARIPATPDEEAFFAALPRPHRLMIIGGPTPIWAMPADDIADVARRLAAHCDRDGGTLIATGSPRTPEEVCARVDQALKGSRHRLVRGATPSYPSLLDDADELFVTADSISMLSEAILSGKAVGMITLEPSFRGRLTFALARVGLSNLPSPNLRRVWQGLLEKGLVGTLDEPKASGARDPVEIAAAAVLRLMSLPERPQSR